jgi:hypothetical protein
MAGIEPFGVNNSQFHAVAGRLARGERLPSMVLVGATGKDDLVVLEGHVRLTALHLVPPEQRATELPVIIGTSERFVDWPLY